MEPESATWSGRRVLVTGADGFIGSQLVERLLSEGAQVRAFCVYNSQGTWGWLEHLSARPPGNLEVFLGDIRDARLVMEACRGIEIVFHLAALIAIPYSYAAPQSFVDTNIGGTLNVLEAIRHHSVERLVHTSTSEVYGTPACLPIRETHPLNAQSPYAASKLGADQMVLAYHRSFQVPAMILRPFNTYGPRQSARAVLPSILVQLLEGKRQIALGRLNPRRDLTFVGDTVEGFLCAATATGVEGLVVQLGTGIAVSIGELFAAACQALGVDAVAVEDPRRLRPEASEVMVLQSDPSLAAQALGWSPAVPLSQGLAQTAAWLRQHREMYHVHTLPI